MPKHVGVKKFWNVLINVHYFLEHLLVLLQVNPFNGSGVVPRIQTEERAGGRAGGQAEEDILTDTLSIL
jgi:hypothetical protein